MDSPDSMAALGPPDAASGDGYGGGGGGGGDGGPALIVESAAATFNDLPDDLYRLAEFRFGFRTVRASVNIAAALLSVAVLVASRWLYRPASPLSILNLHVLFVNVVIAAVQVLFYVETLLIVKFGSSEFHCSALLAQFVAATAFFVASLNLLTVGVMHVVELRRPFFWAATAVGSSGSTLLSRRRSFGVIALEWFGAAAFFAYFYAPRDGFTSAACQTHSVEVFDADALLIITTVVTAPFGLAWILYCGLISWFRCRCEGRDHLRRHGRHHRRRHRTAAAAEFASIDFRQKHLFTSFCVLLTFSIGFLPDLVFAILFCEHCPLFGSDWDSYYLVMAGDMARTALMSTKFVIDPVIYIWRIGEVRRGLREMFLCRRQNVDRLKNRNVDSPENARSISTISTSIIGYYE